MLLSDESRVGPMPTPMRHDEHDAAAAPRRAVQRVVVIGAAGRAGRALVRRATAEGHTVTAFGRDRARIAGAFEGLTPAPRIVPGRIGDAGAVDTAVVDQDVVIVAVGPSRRARPREHPMEQYFGLSQVLTAMRWHEVRRLLLVSAASISVPGDAKARGDRLCSVAARLFRGADVYTKQKQLELLHEYAAKVDWTVVRPSRLVDGGATGRPLIADPHAVRGGRRVPYADLAAWMVDEITARRWVHRLVFLARG